MTHLLQPILACVEAELFASFFKNITEMLPRGCFDRDSAGGRIDDYHVGSHDFAPRVVVD